MVGNIFGFYIFLSILNFRNKILLPLKLKCITEALFTDAFSDFGEPQYQTEQTIKVLRVIFSSIS